VKDKDLLDECKTLLLDSELDDLLLKDYRIPSNDHSSDPVLSKVKSYLEKVGIETGG
jgi:hypothetical protein